MRKLKNYPVRVMGQSADSIRKFRLKSLLVELVCGICDVFILFVCWGVFSRFANSVGSILAFMFISCVLALLLMLFIRQTFLRYITPFRAYNMYKHCRGRNISVKTLRVSRKFLNDLLRSTFDTDFLLDLSGEDVSDYFELYLNDLYCAMGWKTTPSVLKALDISASADDSEIYDIKVSLVSKGFRGKKLFDVVDIEVNLLKEGILNECDIKVAA